MQVPFLNLKAQYMTLKTEITAVIQQVINKTAFAGGPFVAEFEENFAQYCQCDYAIGVNSGTTALWLALLGLGVKPGDEVITVPNTFIATTEAISFAGAKPVFVDIEENTYNMNPDLLEAAITERTKAIIPVHLFGQIADLDPILSIARKHNLLVIEDACQAHGAEYKGKPAGSLADAGCFSFYPGKNLGAYGEGGAIVTNNSELNHKIRLFRDHGQSQKYYHEIIGWNARLDGFQGAILNSEIAGVTVPFEAEYAKHVYHVYAIRVQNRDQLINYLKEKEIYCGIHYPIPIHLQAAYKFLNLPEGSFPVAEKCAAEYVSLPMFPELTGEQIEYAVNNIESFIK